MNDDKHHAEKNCTNYAERIQNARLLAKYIQASLWDEKMNQIREYWLWERSGIHPKKPQHYYR